MSDDPQVLMERRGHLGHIILNRPKAINALTHGMVRQLQAALDVWRDDPAVRQVLLTGTGERGLCAGGDIVSLYQDAIEGNGGASAAFWADEYRLNAAIAEYPKPYVAIMDGIVLGGGIGVSAHASHRVVTERSKLGMPETGIGFVPDVGGTWLLSRAPGELGTFLGLSAGSVAAGDAITLGLADSFVPAESLAELAVALETMDADDAVARFAGPPPTSALAEQRGWIDAAFSADDVPEIQRRLRESGVGEARTAAEVIAAKSPTACAVTLESLRRARGLSSLREALQQEFRVSLRALQAPDFAEGVRAQVIDKDRNPAWQPATADGVVARAVAAYFENLGPRELDFAHPTKGTP